MKKTAAKKIEGAVVVVGGGIAGMQSALDLADGGYRVILVERSPAIGGTWRGWTRHIPPWTALYEFWALRPSMPVGIRT